MGGACPRPRWGRMRRPGGRRCQTRPAQPNSPQTGKLVRVVRHWCPICSLNYSFIIVCLSFISAVAGNTGAPIPGLFHPQAFQSVSKPKDSFSFQVCIFKNSYLDSGRGSYPQRAAFGKRKERINKFYKPLQPRLRHKMKAIKTAYWKIPPSLMCTAAHGVTIRAQSSLCFSRGPAR